MRKILLCFASAMFMFSCSHEENVNGFENDKEVKTYTPAVGYESPYDLNNIDPFFPIKFINNTDHYISYRLSTMAAFFDGNWNGTLDYSVYGGPILTSTNAPLLVGSGSEYARSMWAYSVDSPPNSSVTTDIYSLPYWDRPYNPLEKNFLQKFSKLMYLYPSIEGIGPNILKHDVPPPFANMNILPPIMNSNNYKEILGVPAYNVALNQPMGISVYHIYSREIIWPNMPNFQSDIFFTGPGGASLHLYFKTYVDHIEIVLE